MKNNNRFYRDQRGVIALSLSIIMPLIIGLLVLGFDLSSYYRAHSRLNESLREASLGANMLENDGQKRQYVDNFIRAYLDDENIKISDIAYQNEIINTGSSNNRNSTPNPSGNIDTVNYSATLTMPGWFGGFFDPQNEATLKANSKVEPTHSDGVGDFLFVMDFTRSMTLRFFGSTDRISFCRADHENFDPFICQKIRSGNDKASVMQGVVIKTIEMINAMSGNTSEFAFLPTYDGAFQFQKEVSSSTRGGSSLPAKYFGLQVSFKPQYRLSDYDFWSGAMPRSYATHPFHMTFETPPYKDHPEVNNAWNFFTDIYIPNPYTNVIEMMENALPKMIDYQETFKNMFDPDKIFSFKFYEDSDLDPSSPQARRNGIAYDSFGSERNIRDRATRSLGAFYEQDFQRVSNPRALPVLNIPLRDVVNTRLPDVGFISPAILRGAAMLTKGKHRKRTMFVILDIGTVSNNLSLSEQTLQTLVGVDLQLISMGMCKRIIEGMHTRGVEAEIFIINIAQKTEAEKILEIWRQCSGENHAAVVEDIDEFFEALKNFILRSQLGRFIER